MPSIFRALISGDKMVIIVIIIIETANANNLNNLYSLITRIKNTVARVIRPNAVRSPDR